MLKVSGLSYELSGRKVLSGLDFEVPTGGSLGIVGPNGSGKSLLLQLLAAQRVPTQGEVQVLGHGTGVATTEARSRVGYLPEVHPPFADLTVAGVLSFFATAYQVPVEEQAPLVVGLLELVDLLEMGDTPVTHLSRGQRQRLAIARTLVHDPDVVILDAPLDVVDLSTRTELVSVLAELSRMHKGLVVTSNHIGLLTQVCDQFAILYGGKLIALGTLDEVVHAAGLGPYFAVHTDRDAEAMQVLRGHGGLLEVFELGDGGVGAVPSESPPTASELDRLLMDAGLSVSGVVRKEPTLEDAYRRLIRRAQQREASANQRS